jgi:flagellar hook assembly protein FlgD
VPFHGEVRFTLSLAEASDVSLEVFDVAGRKVRTVSRGLPGAGNHAAAWDGRTDSGETAIAGVYFIRCATPEGKAVRLAVKLR